MRYPPYNPQSVTAVGLANAAVIANGPAAFAYASANRNGTMGGAWDNTQPPNAERFDTASIYDTTTGKMTPNVAGYYNVAWSVTAGAYTGSGFSGTGFLRFATRLTFNGALWQMGSALIQAPGGQGYTTSTGCATVYCNGTTDYLQVEYFATQNGTGMSCILLQPVYTFNVEMVRP